MDNERKIYQKLYDSATNGSSEIVQKNDSVFLAKGKLFLDIIKNVPPRLSQEDAEVPLETIYDAGFHKKTGAMFVCNKGAYLLARAPKSDRYYGAAHLGFSIYMPQHGIELVDVGIAGDITQGDFIILRPESACAPGFIIGSQRCNCHDQWNLVRELAVYHNPIELPKTTDPDKFEHFIADYFKPDKNNVPIPKDKGRGFIFLHMATQNGMGSGATEGHFTEDMTATAYMRHRGEYTAEQVHNVSLAGGFTALGISPDPRKLNDHAGYKIPAVILDYFCVEKPIIALTNNRDKIKILNEMGFNITRIQFIGRSDVACGVETNDRRKEFLHIIPDDFKTSLEDDLKRVDDEIHRVFKTHHKKMKYSNKLPK